VNSKQRLLAGVSNYSLASILGIAASLISFPVLTRLLSVSDYGLMNLVSVSIVLLVAIGKGGLQTSAIRFYAEIESGKTQWTMSNYYATLIYGMVAVSLTVMVSWATGSLIYGWYFSNLSFACLLALTAVLIPVRVMESALLNILKAGEKSFVHSVYTIARKYGLLVIIVAALVWIAATAHTFYLATIVGESIALLALAWYTLKPLPKLRDTSGALLWQMAAFGIPMIGYEIAGNILNLSDRYVIEWKLGHEQVGIYSASYNLVDYLSSAIVNPFVGAFMPVCLSLWANGEKIAVQEFLGQSLRYYLLIAIPVIAGIAAVGSELIHVMASEKYLVGAEIIPYVTMGMFIHGATVFFGAGLYINKQGITMSLIVLLAAVINLLLNLLWVPRYGIMGAAFATMAASFIIVVLSSWYGRQVLRVTFPYLYALKLALIASAMYWVVGQVEVPLVGFTLLAKIMAGMVFFATVMWCVDGEIRALVSDIAGRVRNGLYG